LRGSNVFFLKVFVGVVLNLGGASHGFIFSERSSL